MVPYPDGLQLDAVNTIIDIVKENQILERRCEFVLCLWNVQGTIQEVAFGDLNKIVASKPLEDLESSLQSVLEDDDLQASVVDAPNWLLIMQLIKMILEFINRFETT